MEVSLRTKKQKEYMELSQLPYSMDLWHARTGGSEQCTVSQACDSNQSYSEQWNWPQAPGWVMHNNNNKVEPTVLDTDKGIVVLAGVLVVGKRIIRHPQEALPQQQYAAQAPLPPPSAAPPSGLPAAPTTLPATSTAPASSAALQMQKLNH